MAMKQTQTKLFDFSDAGLDFCAGSKNLFPDRFKKMLTLGYNVQTVSSVAVAGNQVTFTYGGAHGYVADRVLKVDSGALALINGGEFWIDSVTVNTVTITIENAPTSVIGGFTTRIAPLGWTLEYELSNVHIYKMKQLDESDLYVRLCFQNNSAYKNCIGVCVGKSHSAGAITDPESIAADRAITTPQTNGLNWFFTSSALDLLNNYTYSQGFSWFGKAVIVGSLYHFVAMFNNGVSGTTNDMQGGSVAAILPCAKHSYAANLPLIIAQTGINPSGTTAIGTFVEGRAFIGTQRCIFEARGIADQNIFSSPSSASSFTALDGFNTTTAQPIAIHESTTTQHIGYIVGGMYRCLYGATNVPPSVKQSTPSQTMDIDLSNSVILHSLPIAANNIANTIFLAVPIEEIKIA